MAKFLLYSDLYMPVITLLVYISIWKTIQKQELFILVYCAFSAVLFSIADMLAENGVHNVFLYHLNSIVELWMFAYYILKKGSGKGFTAPFFIIGASYTVFFILNILFWEDLGVFNSNSAGLASLIILFLCMSYLLKLSKSDEILYFQKLPTFWITSGFLIYNAVSVLVLLSYKYFVYEKMINQGTSLWFVLSAANIVKFALISTGLLCHKKRQATHLPFLL